MAETNIEWSDVVWNPVRGCSKVSPGCTNCYAERTAARFAGPGRHYDGLVRIGDGSPRWTGEVRLVPEKLDEPRRWRKPRRVFVNSMSDLFHEKLTDHEIRRVVAAMARAPQHTFQVLTKRPRRMLAVLRSLETERFVYDQSGRGAWPLSNAHVGVSVENQAAADERIPLLLKTPAAVRFLSVEPLLGPVDLMRLRGIASTVDRFIDWVIVGGESGPGARPCDVAWIRSVVQQCKDAGVPCFVKQLGAVVIEGGGIEVLGRDFPNLITDRVPGGWRALLADRKGGDPSEWPPDLRVREFPEVRS